MHRFSRRHVITTISSTAVMLCPAILNARTVEVDWGGIPTTEPIGQNQTLTVGAGPATVEISALQPGEVAVIARPTDDANYSSTGMTQFIAVHRRTPEQIAFGEANDPAGSVQNPAYFVVNLLCTHRGKAIGLTGDPAAPFACTDRGSRHSSVYDASGLGVSGASEDERLSTPEHTLAVDGETVVLTLA